MLNRIIKNPLTWIILAAGIFAYWLFKKAVAKVGAAGAAVAGAVAAGGQAVKSGVENATVAAANALGINEAGGFANSAGQNDPLLIFNMARIAYATSKGYAPGTYNFKNPPGFPTLEEYETGAAITGL
jgi:Flp pilus assembly protein TadG